MAVGCACLLSCIVLLGAGALQPPDQDHRGGLQSCHGRWLKCTARGAGSLQVRGLQRTCYRAQDVIHLRTSPYFFLLSVLAFNLHFNICHVKNLWFFLMPLLEFFLHVEKCSEWAWSSFWMASKILRFLIPVFLYSFQKLYNHVIFKNITLCLIFMSIYATVIVMLFTQLFKFITHLS